MCAKLNPFILRPAANPVGRNGTKVTRKPHGGGNLTNTAEPPANLDPNLEGTQEWSLDHTGATPYSVPLPEQPTPNTKDSRSQHMVLNTFQFDQAPVGGESGNAIPAGATITGIHVAFTYREHDGVGGQIKTKIVQLTDDSSTRRGRREFSDAISWPGTAPGKWVDPPFSAGGEDDLWDTTWTVGQITSADFGVIIQVRNALNQLDLIAEIQDVIITVWYT